MNNSKDTNALRINCLCGYKGKLENMICPVCKKDYNSKDKGRKCPCDWTGRKHKKGTKKLMSLKKAGALNHKWRGGVKNTSLGYRMIKSPTHPNRDSQGYVMEHRLVMEAHLGRYLLKTEIVHHINGDTKDNRIENLALYSSNSGHLKDHHKERKK